MQSPSTGLPHLDSLLGSDLPAKAVLGLSGSPGTGKQCLAAAYALARARCCWISPIEERPYLPPLLGNRWTEALGTNRLELVVPNLLDDDANALVPLVQQLIHSGHRSFVLLHTEILAHLTSVSECVRIVYLLRRAGCEALLVSEETSFLDNGTANHATQPWESLADVLLRTEPAGIGGPALYRLLVPKPPSPDRAVESAEFTIDREGICFSSTARDAAPSGRATPRATRSHASRKRRVYRVMPELYYLDAEQEQYARRRNEEINARQTAIQYQLPAAPFTDSIEYNQSVERFRKGEPVEDLFIIDIYRLRECVEKGLIQPLDNWVDDAWRARFLPKAIEACTYNGQLWAIPHWMNAGVLIYRRDLLKKHNLAPPTTFNQLVEISQTVLRGENRNLSQGFGYQGAVAEALSCCFLEFLWNHGGDVVTSDLKPRIRERAALSAIEFMHNLVHDLGISPHETASLTEAGTAELFWEDRLLFMRKWPNFLCRFPANSRVPGLDAVGMAPLPTLRANIPSQAVLGGFAYVLPSQVIDPEPLLAYHAQFHDEEGVRQMALAGWACSPYQAAYHDPVVLDGRPWYADLPHILATGRSRQDVPFYHRVTTLLREEINLVLRRLRSPAEALEFIAAQLETQILRQADANRLQGIIDYLRDNLDAELSREEIAARCNLNPSYFSSLFKEVTGETFRRFVNRERIRKAQRLLVTSEQSAGDIARSVGFTDPSYFSQVFREYSGMTPIEHRAEARRRVGHH